MRIDNKEEGEGEVFTEQQALLQQIVSKGGKVLGCPMRSQKYGVAASDFLDGAKLTTLGITSPELLTNNARTLSWEPAGPPGEDS